MRHGGSSCSSVVKEIINPASNAAPVRAHSPSLPPPVGSMETGGGERGAAAVTAWGKRIIPNMAAAASCRPRTASEPVEMQNRLSQEEEEGGKLLSPHCLSLEQINEAIPPLCVKAGLSSNAPCSRRQLEQGYRALLTIRRIMHPSSSYKQPKSPLQNQTLCSLR